MTDYYVKNNETDMTGEALGKAWLNKNWPVMRVADVNWTMERGDFPQHARGYIFKNWIKVNDEGGGTYCEPSYYETKYKNQMIARGKMPPAAEDERHQRRDEVDVHGVPASQPSNGMDKRNQTALHVLQTKGPAAAVKHMFTDDKTGRELSYSEMRSRYG